MWEVLEIEKELQQALVAQCGEAEGETLYGDYTAIRSQVPAICEEIKRREANLTDHGPRHIADVLGQAHQLIPQDYFDARERLALALSILFHDTGNIHGREGHEKKISDIYSFVRGSPLQADKLEEKKIILAVVGAHGGEARDGSKDTIKDLDPVETYLRKPIRIREIAAIVRLADELAEGPHRTCEYLRRRHGFPVESEKYHDYASITSICIDPALERIALSYQISTYTQDGHIDKVELTRLRRLLAFSYYRICKLNEERQYARYYCSALDKFKRTSATLNFWLDDEPLDFGLEPLELTDLVVPGGNTRQIPEINEAYKIEVIVTKLLSACVTESDPAGDHPKFQLGGFLKRLLSLD